MKNKTADDVDFVPKMALYESGGKKISNSYIFDDDLLVHPWIWKTKNRYTGWLLRELYSSYESATADNLINQCFVCDKQLQSNGPRHKDEVIGMMHSDALFFRATGNFGSTIFDPMDYQFLEIVICDDCVIERQARLRYWGEKTRDPQGPPYKRK